MQIAATYYVRPSDHVTHLTILLENRYPILDSHCLVLVSSNARGTPLYLWSVAGQMMLFACHISNNYFAPITNVYFTQISCLINIWLLYKCIGTPNLIVRQIYLWRVRIKNFRVSIITYFLIYEHINHLNFFSMTHNIKWFENKWLISKNLIWWLK